MAWAPEKTCSNCKTSKSVAEFQKRARSKDGLQAWCRPCMGAASMNWQRENRDRCNALQRKRRHGIEDAAQGPCEICGTTDGIFVYDHDHACCPPGRTCTECRRGVTCSPCNLVLGNAFDNPAVLRAAADYLERTQRGVAA